MGRQSAGILLYRLKEEEIEVLLVHPGGPLWAKKDEGCWSVPKGEYGAGEAALPAAVREFAEETGFALEAILTRPDMVALDPVRQSGGKTIVAWLAQGDCDAEAARSNTFVMEWPPRSGRKTAFAEVDRAAWFPLALAYRKIVKGQRGLLDQARRLLTGDGYTRQGPDQE